MNSMNDWNRWRSSFYHKNRVNGHRTCWHHGHTSTWLSCLAQRSWLLVEATKHRWRSGKELMDPGVWPTSVLPTPEPNLVRLPRLIWCVLMARFHPTHVPLWMEAAVSSHSKMASLFANNDKDSVHRTHDMLCHIVLKLETWTLN